jgi:hypothetical protein
MYFATAAADPAQLTWTAIFLILFAVAALVGIIWSLGRLFPSSKKYTAGAGNALMRADVFFRPSREHVLEAKEHEQKEDESSGDPPDSSTT